MKSPGLDFTNNSKKIKQAVAILQGGGVIAHPTETIFGLGVAANNSEALDRLFLLKGRSKNKGLILLIPDREYLLDIVEAQSLKNPLVQALMATFWPGPLTLALPARPEVSSLLTGGNGYIASRHSSSPLVAELLTAFGGGVVSTSANRSGGPPLLDHLAVDREFGDELGYVIPGSCSVSSLASTVLMVEKNSNRVKLLRSGAVSLESIRAALWEVDPLLDVVVPDGVDTHLQ
jgi:L-threonylcarbamoyladenylate synthase